MKKVLQLQGITLRSNCRWVPKKYKYIMIRSTLYCRYDEDYMKKAITTDKWLYICNHHRIHSLQKDALGSWIKFYKTYFKYWFKIFRKSKSKKIAYRFNPFELEAFQEQYNLRYSNSQILGMLERFDLHLKEMKKSKKSKHD